MAGRIRIIHKNSCLRSICIFKSFFYLSSLSENVAINGLDLACHGPLLCIIWTYSYSICQAFVKISQLSWHYSSRTKKPSKQLSGHSECETKNLGPFLQLKDKTASYMKLFDIKANDNDTSSPRNV